MLEVNAIDLHYGAAQALRGISIKAEVGKVTCVLGRNGVGKTSLLRAIVGQKPVSAGSISLGGTDITKLPTVERALRAGASCWIATAGVRPVMLSTSGRGRRSRNCFAYVLTLST